MERAKHHSALAVRASTNPLLRNRQSDSIASEKRQCGSQPNRRFCARNGRSLLRVDVNELYGDDFL
jgi:hypothetical protein